MRSDRVYKFVAADDVVEHVENGWVLMQISPQQNARLMAAYEAMAASRPKPPAPRKRTPRRKRRKARRR